DQQCSTYRTDATGFAPCQLPGCSEKGTFPLRRWRRACIVRANNLFTPMHVGPQVHALRKERGLSLRALAERASVSASMLCDLEKGQVNPTVGTLFQISSALGVPAHSLFPPAQDSHAGAGGPSEEQGSTPASPVVRVGERPTIPLTGGIQWQRLTPSAEPVE